MNRTKVMFFAFIGNQIEQQEAILSIKDGYECWDLKKMTLDGFIEELQKKIPPVNDNVLRNYKVSEGSKDMFGVTEKQYEKCSWGLLIPETFEEGGFSNAEILSIINLYAPHFMYPCFYANDIGITKLKYDKDPLIYFHDQKAVYYQTAAFVDFYKLLFEQGQYGTWYLERAKTWDKDDWRLFVASHLYKGLMDYENSKSSFTWQRESAEMVTILEALFTADDSRNEEVMYRLRKRMAVLLAWKYPDVEKDIKTLYSDRSEFVHGSFFKRIKKEGTLGDLIPIPDFELLYKHKEYVRIALVAYLNLTRVIRLGNITGVISAMDALEKAIIDIKLREQIIAETEKLFALMPEATLQR